MKRNEDDIKDTIALVLAFIALILTILNVVLRVF